MIIQIPDGFQIDLINKVFIENSSCTHCGLRHEFVTIKDETIVRCVPCEITGMKLGEEMKVSGIHINFWINNIPLLKGFTNE